MAQHVDMTAVVLTHRRPRLATSLVRSLLQEEGLPPDRIVLVIDRDGGLEDRSLEQAVRVIRLAINSGPAAGFRVGLEEAFRDPGTSYAYLCEDDAGLWNLPMPRLPRIRAELRAHESRTGRQVGAVVSSGRRFSPTRPGATLPFLPDPAGPPLQRVDVAGWVATLVSRRVHDMGVRPDDYWFFGFEDFDYFLKIGEHDLDVVVDRDTALATQAAWLTLEGQDAAHEGQRPRYGEEPWRAFYVARNFFELARRHGDLRWTLWHLALCARRFQLARDPATRNAILAGTAHGLARRGGRNPRYVRSLGELRPR